MLSAKRIVEIFRRRVGGEFANLADKLTPDQFAYLKNMADGEPVIARMCSEDDWFVLTMTHLITKRAAKIRRVPLGEICSVAFPRTHPREVEVFKRIKSDGGDMDIGLQDGTTLRMKAEPGGTYIGLMNVLMRFATINHRQRSRTSSDAVSPTTTDQRPTTQL